MMRSKIVADKQLLYTSTGYSVLVAYRIICLLYTSDAADE